MCKDKESRMTKMKKWLHSRGRRVCAAVLCGSLVLCSVANGQIAALGSKSDVTDFRLHKVSMYHELEKAVEKGKTVAEDLEFEGEAAGEYEELFAADGSLYELTASAKKSDGLKLRVFARLDGEADPEEAYEIDGSEEIIFLLSNTTDQVKTAVVHVDRQKSEPIRVVPRRAVPTSADAAEEVEASGDDAVWMDGDDSAEDALIPGTVYDAVLLGNHGAVAVSVNAGDLGLDDPKYASDAASGSNAAVNGSSGAAGGGTGVATASNAARVFTAETEHLVVSVTAGTGVFPEDAVLRVTELKEDDAETADQFKEAKDALDAEETEYDGMMALDITFTDGSGNEIEPDGEVSVAIEMKAEALPEDADPESLTVQHLAETGDGIEVRTVADAADVTAGTVETIESEDENETAVVAAAFAVDGFSYFTITWRTTSWWGSESSVVVYFVDEEGTEIDSSTSAENITGNYGKVVRLEDQAKEISGYEYIEARIGDPKNGDPAIEVRATTTTTGSGMWQETTYSLQYNNGGSWKEIDNGTKIFLVYEDKKSSGTEILPGQKLSHEKYAERREDGSYDLTLTIAGQTGSISNPAQLDVIYVLDVSGSMNYYMDSDKNVSSGDSSKSRRAAAGDAINGLTNKLEANSKLDVRYALVTFSGTTGDGAWNDADVVQWWTKSGDKITDNSSPTSDGGTNYEAGLIEAGNLLESKREKASTAVIFISDGNPGYYYNTSGNTTGSGSSYNATALERAEEEAAKLDADYFFTVGVGPSGNYSRLEDLKDSATKVPADGRQFYKGTDTVSLNAAFDKIQDSILELLCSNVTVADTLSEYVQMAVTSSGSPESLRITVTNAEGTEVGSGLGTVTLGSGEDAVTIRASYDTAAKQITLDFPDDYELQKGYTYSVTAHIEPTEAAYAAYRNNNLVYPDTPDAGTGTHGPVGETAVKENGFYSNAADSAYVTYTYNGQDHKELYPRPVVQLDPGTLVIEKTVRGLDENGLTGTDGLESRLNFAVNLRWNGQSSSDTKNIHLNDSNVIKTSSGSDGSTVYTYTCTVGGLSPNTDYTVIESNYEVAGYDVQASPSYSVTGTVGKGETKTAQFTNVYTEMKKVTVTKQVAGNMGEIGSTSKKYSFSYTVGEGTSPTGSFELADGESYTIGQIPTGSKVVISETAADGYEVSWKLGDSLTDNKTSVYTIESVAADTSLTCINRREVAVPTGLTMDNRPYLLMLLAAAGAVLNGFVCYGRRRKDDE